MRVSPHLCFAGSCRAAFTAYHSILGGSLVTMLTYGESPMAGRVAPELHSQIIHATLRVGDLELTGVDIPPSEYRTPQGFFVTITVDDVAEAQRIFNALAEEGQVILGFKSTFWSPGFGVLVDRFGVPWELNCEGPSAA
jgi:PhnB protein